MQITDLKKFRSYRVSATAKSPLAGRVVIVQSIRPRPRTELGDHVLVCPAGGGGIYAVAVADLIP